MLIFQGVGIGGATIQSPLQFLFDPLMLRCHAESHLFFGGAGRCFLDDIPRCARTERRNGARQEDQTEGVSDLSREQRYGCRRLEREELQHAASVTNQPFLLVVFSKVPEHQNTWTCFTELWIDSGLGTIPCLHIVSASEADFLSSVLMQEQEQKVLVIVSFLEGFVKLTQTNPTKSLSFSETGPF